MKNKLIFFGLVLTLVLCFFGCDRTKVDEKPVFAGLEDVTVEKGGTFNPLDGVTINDKEDGPVDVSAVTVDNGGFNINVEGIYTFTYSVTDSYGNTTTETRKVTVSYTDIVAPVFYGVQEKSIIIGDSSYRNTDDVTAIDNVDGPVTDDIVATGNVDVWTLGEYDVSYEVEDAASNKATATKKIIVGLGSFNFLETNALGTAHDNKEITITGSEYNAVLDEVSGGVINSEYADFALVKLVLKAKSTVAKELSVTLAGATSNSSVLAIGTESQEFVKYFRISAALVDASLSLVVNAGDATLTIEEIALYFGSAVDEEAPEVTIEVNNDVYVPVNCPLAVVKTELLRDVSAFDNMDGFLTSVLDIELGSADLGVAGEYTVKVVAEDGSGNKGELERKLVVAKARDTGFITDPDFNNATTDQFGNSIGDGVTTLEIVNGELVHTTTTLGNWPSANSPYIRNLTTSILQKDYYYMLKMDVKANGERQIQIRAGHEVGSDPWIEDFAGGRPRYSLTTEWQTLYYIFKVERDKSSEDSANIKFEINCGAIAWSDAEKNGVIYFDNVQFYKLSNLNENPAITQVPDIKTTYPVGEAAPDLKAFITASDLEDGNIVITDDMVNNGGLDMNTAGEYTVVYTVTDSEGGTASHEILIKVIAEVDTEGPVISIDPLALTFLETNQPVQGVDLSGVIETLAGYITITDNVDGNIPFVLSMVNLDGLNLQSPAAGSYDIAIQTSDSSSNASNVLNLTIVVKDTEPPKFIFAGLPSLYVGATFNPLEGVVISDNLDGFSPVTLDHITGLDQFIDATGKVTAAGTFSVVYTAVDASENEGVKTLAITVEETGTDFYDGASIDVLSKISWLSAGGGTSTKEVSPDGGIVVNYSPAPSINYAAGVHLKCDSNISLVSGATYKLVIEAKAEIAREFVIYFVNSNSEKISGFQNADGGKVVFGLMQDYYVYEYVFTVANETASGCTFEIDLNYDDALGLANGRKEQALNFKQVKLYSTDGILGTAEDLPKVVVFNDFEAYADDEAYQALDTDNIVGNRIGTGAFVKSKGQLVEEAGNKGLLQNFAYEGGSTNGIRVKINKADIPVNIQYLAFWVKASNISKVSKFQSFIYNNSGGYKEVTNFTNTVEGLVDGMFVYLPVSEIQNDTIEISLVINIQSEALGTLYFDDILFTEEKLTSYGSVVLEDFEEYDDINTIIVGNRMGGSGFLPENGAVELDGENHLLVQDFAYDTNGTNGVRFKITKVDVPVGIKYIAVYMKASTDVGVTSFKAYCYNSGYEDISSSVIGDLTKLVDGTYVYIPVSMLKDNTTEVSMMINVGGSASGELSFDNLSLVKEFYPVLDVNQAPVVSISDENLNLLSGMTFKAGVSLETVLSSLIGMIEITDAEDGYLTPLASMVDLGGLNLASPVMGTYNLKIQASDSLDKVSNELVLPISIVTVIEDFESFADDAAFKAEPRFIGFRIKGSEFLPANGSLVVGEDNKYLQQNFETGSNATNGIKFYVSKADLVAAGASYIGIHVKTSTVDGISKFQTFGYDSTHHEIIPVSNLAAAAQGTYVYIPVSALGDTYESIAIMINVASGTGTMIFDNIVIK